jgi:hypothetical protein
LAEPYTPWSPSDARDQTDIFLYGAFQEVIWMYMYTELNWLHERLHACSYNKDLRLVERLGLLIA